jgi:aminoglycoside/choline kinase family phosphotransferase
MESTEEQIKADRKNQLENWLKTTAGVQYTAIDPMTGDASFRRYFRVYTVTDSFVAMDAPPPQENCVPFVAIAKTLRAKGLKAPEVIAEDIDRGFLLITDFGDDTYLKALTADNADTLYGSALKALSVLQGCVEAPPRQTPLFTGDFMRQEWAWHKEWFIQKLLGLRLGPEMRALDLCYAQIVDSAVCQPQVFMHRDYHSANLMVLPKQEVGILDFQDAFIGPVTYDLVSLLRDCYIDWPEDRVNTWALQYRQMLIDLGVVHHSEQHEFLRWFDLMGVERHLKALFTFSRKYVRDHQPQYLKHIPRTLNYLISVCRRYPELNAMHL